MSTKLPTYGLEWDPAGDCTQVGSADCSTEFNAHFNLDGWYTLEDDNGVKAYFGDEALACFVQRVIDPGRWQYLTAEDKALLRAALDYAGPAKGARTTHFARVQYPSCTRCGILIKQRAYTTDSEGRDPRCAECPPGRQARQ